MAKQPRQSIAVYDKILESEPDQPDALSGADVLLLSETCQGRGAYRHALKASPDDATLLNNLAWVLATSPETKVRNGEQALQLAKKATHEDRIQRSVYSQHVGRRLRRDR